MRFRRSKQDIPDPVSVDVDPVLDKVQAKIDELNAASDRLENASKKGRAVLVDLERSVARATELSRKPRIRNS